MIYIDSITGRARHDVDAWAKTLKESNTWLRRATQQEIIESMNRREYICTPGFLLRRQIQTFFPELMKAAGVENCADLAAAGNVPWEEKSVKALSNVLAGTFFDEYGGKLLDSRQWVNYLEDRALCQRATAIKLIFALKMDDATAAKFLIANDNNLFSARNPFDFICNFCLMCTPRIPYVEACEMLSAFEETRATAEKTPAAQKKPAVGMTADMTNETATLAQDDTIGADDKKQKLLAYMAEIEGEFVDKVPKKNQEKTAAVVEMEYPSGFSLLNIGKLKMLLNYLAMLYPGNIFIGEDDEPVAKAVEVDANGVPRLEDFTAEDSEHHEHYEQGLIHAMYYAQGIELKDYLELKLPARGRALNEYNKIPFNKNVLLRLKNLSNTLRATIRAETHPANAQDISRSTIMILAYFFITGYLYADEVTARALVSQLKQDEKSAAKSNEKMLIEALRQVTRNLDALANSEKPLQIFTASLNWLLTCFHLNAFYPPFVLDRFIMICLLADPLEAPVVDEYENSLQFLMQLVISENYAKN